MMNPQLRVAHVDPEYERRGLQTLISMRVDGALIACYDNTTATYDLVSRRKTPAVFSTAFPWEQTRFAFRPTTSKRAGSAPSIWLIRVTRESPLWRAESNSHPTRIASKVSARQCAKPDCPYWTSISEPIFVIIGNRLPDWETTAGTAAAPDRDLLHKQQDPPRTGARLRRM